jgi:MurNAc alpha-1-phosphate uridylyltransferase
VVINLSWLGDQIRGFLGGGAQFGVSIEYSEESVALETAGGILQALPLLGDRFVVVNADVFTNYDFSKLKTADRLADRLAHLVLVDNPEHNDSGDFSLDGTTVGNLGVERHTFSGIAQYHRDFFSGLTPGKQALAPLLRAAADKEEVSGELFTGNWIDIGTAERLARLND